MTVKALAPAPSGASAPARIWDVVRLHVANPWNTLVVPWVITFAIFGLNLAIWLMVASAAGGVENLEPDAFAYNGGISWLAVFMMVVAVQAMNLTFKFALGFSVTRRDYYLGSVLYFVLLSLLYATGVTAIAAVERATDGWGLGAAFFAPWGLPGEPIATIWFLYLMVLLLFFFLGAAVATVWVRWGPNGLYAFFIGLAALVVGAGWFVTTTDSWPAVGEFFTSRSLVELAAWTLPLSIACGVVGHLFLRRSTPRS
ncbi:ABC transporter permease [Demequina sp. SO4-18]|uniref:ABC transporter permease n=1 Tax=Demequina sp. SO4-18 TaxID=3401026 RepID=UPI003B599B74